MPLIARHDRPMPVSYLILYILYVMSNTRIQYGKRVAALYRTVWYTNHHRSHFTARVATSVRTTGKKRHDAHAQLEKCV